MPKRTDISSILVISAGPIIMLFALAACEAEGSRSETVTPGEPTAAVADCAKKFEKHREAWGDDPVRAIFVYELGKGVRWQDLTGPDPEDAGAHYMTYAGGNAADAQARFLEAGDEADTHVFIGDDMTLLRMRGDEMPFEEAVREGCERLREGVSIKQVTIQRGVA